MSGFYRGEPGGLRPKPKSRNREHRDYVRMIQPAWIPPTEDAEAIRRRMTKIAIRSKDHRAAVTAAGFVFNAEASVKQSAIAIHAAQIDFDTEEPESEEGNS